MKVAIIGSRSIKKIDLEIYIPKDVTEIVSGGAIGIDRLARNYAIKNKIKLTEFLPDYDNFGRVAPLKRNIEIIEQADLVIAFWDGKSKGTQFVIENCLKTGKEHKVFVLGNI